jgi:D-alanyl-D-alanine carboxypeptidase/D-alanyl-D-alanine-endopeptidase (penicillin-binding protein 4)
MDILMRTIMRAARPAATLVLALIAAGCETAPEAAGPITTVHVYTAPAPVGLDALIERHRLNGARVGYVLYDLARGERLAARNENEPFVPASTIKVATSVAALNILGPDYRFETRLLATGAVAGSVLNGNLYLQGGGDPLLQPQDLMALAQRLRDAGVSSLSGQFFYDVSLLAGTDQISARWPDNARYNPGVDALSLDFNRTLLTWRQKGEAGTVEAFETPAFDDPGPGLAEAGAGRNIVYAGPQRAGRWLLSPAAPPKGNEYLPVKTPGLRTARVFRRFSNLLGVDLPEPQAAAAPANARVLGSVGSPPLREVVRQSLEHSNNMVAELIGQVAARRLTGKPAPLADSAAALTGWLKKAIPGVAWDGFVMPNHSGLADDARVSPEQMSAILRFALQQRYAGDFYQSMLPVSGYRNAMGGRLRDPTTALRVWAKTGTLRYSKGLAGVLFTQQGREVVFALYVTDFDRLRAHGVPADAPPPEVAAARDWTRRAFAFQEDLVREWIIQY